MGTLTFFLRFIKDAGSKTFQEKEKEGS